MFWKISFLFLVFSTILQTASYELGNNLLQNSQFTQPNVSISWQYFSGSIPGWRCSNSCQINSFRLSNLNCSNQALDLTSDFIENVSQTFQTQAGAHLFYIQFLLPTWFANQKILIIYLNEYEIYRFYPQVNNDNLVYNFTSYVYPLEGNNTLRLTMDGRNDFMGFKITSVSISRIIDEGKQQLIYGAISNNIMKSTISFPASRLILGEIANTFISFDRLQLYYYHNRNYSYYSTIFLRQISNLLDYKGSLSLTIQQSLFGNAIQKQKEFFKNLEYKYQYINTEVLERSDDGYGFVANNNSLVVYSIPFIIAITILLNVLFYLSFNCKFSRIFRKYSYYAAIFFIMVCEGNIQQFSFYMFGEFLTFFSKTFAQKIINTFLSMFFFMVVLVSVSLYLWLWGLYKTKLWCIVDNIRLSCSGMMGYSIDRGVICLLLGAVHQLLLPYPNMQLLSLGLCEILWIIAQIIGLVHQIYQCRLLVCFNIIEGILRIIFQLTLFLYAKTINNGMISSFLNQEILLRQILFFFAIWIFQFIICLFLLLKDLLPVNHSKQKMSIQFHLIYQ